jgi:hypothetical protein
MFEVEYLAYTCLFTLAFRMQNIASELITLLQFANVKEYTYLWRVWAGENFFHS